MHSDSRWLKAKELAAEFRISTSAVRLWTRRGMPCLHVGKRLVRFNPVEVEDWLRKGSNARRDDE